MQLNITISYEIMYLLLFNILCLIMFIQSLKEEKHGIQSLLRYACKLHYHDNPLHIDLISCVMIYMHTLFNGYYFYETES